jgi:hypothetical protein
MQTAWVARVHVYPSNWVSDPRWVFLDSWMAMHPLVRLHESHNQLAFRTLSCL